MVLLEIVATEVSGLEPENASLNNPDLFGLSRVADSNENKLVTKLSIEPYKIYDNKVHSTIL